MNLLYCNDNFTPLSSLFSYLFSQHRIIAHTVLIVFDIEHNIASAILPYYVMLTFSLIFPLSTMILGDEDVLSHLRVTVLWL